MSPSAKTGSTKNPLQESSLELRPVELCPFTVDGRPRPYSFTVGLVVDVGQDLGLSPELRSYPTLHTVYSRNLTAFAAIEGRQRAWVCFPQALVISREGWRVPLYVVQGCRGMELCPCLYAKHLNCPFIIVSDFFHCWHAFFLCPILSSPSIPPPCSSLAFFK